MLSAKRKKLHILSKRRNKEIHWSKSSKSEMLPKSKINTISGVFFYAEPKLYHVGIAKYGKCCSHLAL